MLRTFLATLTGFALLFALTATALAGDIEFGDFLQRVNLSAEADLPGFKARLSTDFALPLPKVEAVLKSLPTPADAYMCLRVGQVAGKPVEAVVSEYRRNAGKGWGVIARNLGIKPGSREFHALKEGRFDAPAQGGGGKGKEHGRKK